MLRELLAVRIFSSGPDRSLRCPEDDCGHQDKELSPCASGCRICESVFADGRDLPCLVL